MYVIFWPKNSDFNINKEILMKTSNYNLQNFYNKFQKVTKLYKNIYL
jgi:hypothetical protein